MYLGSDFLSRLETLTKHRSYLFKGIISKIKHNLHLMFDNSPFHILIYFDITLTYMSYFIIKTSTSVREICTTAVAMQYAATKLDSTTVLAKAGMQEMVSSAQVRLYM